MTGSRIDIVLIFGFVLVVTGVILQSISEATTYWIYADVGGSRHIYHIGLFKWCFQDSCRTPPSFLDVLKRVQALTLSGLVLAVLVVCPLLILVTIQGYRYQLKSSTLGASAGILAFLSGVLTFSGAMVFLVQFYNRYFEGQSSDLKLGYSFVLNIVGAIVTGVGGIAAWIGTHRLAAFANRTPGQTFSSVTPNSAVVYSVGNAPIRSHINISQPDQSFGMQPYAGPMYANTLSYPGPAMSFPPGPPPPYSEVVTGKMETK